MTELYVLSSGIYLWAPEIVAVVIKARVDLEVGIRGFEVACEGLKVVKLLLEVRAEQEAADLHAEVCHQA